METEKNKKPAHEIRIGQVKGVIWTNTNANSTWHSTTFCRIYRDGDEWKQTSSFNRDDLLVIAKVADLAHTWICEQRNQPTE